MRTGHIHILRESASVLEMHENRGFTVRTKTHLGMQTTNEVHTQTHRSASSLLHMPELLNMHLTPGFKEYSVELKKKETSRDCCKAFIASVYCGLVHTPMPLQSTHKDTHARGSGIHMHSSPHFQLSQTLSRLCSNVLHHGQAVVTPHRS